MEKSGQTLSRFELATSSSVERATINLLLCYSQLLENLKITCNVLETKVMNIKQINDAPTKV